MADIEVIENEHSPDSDQPAAPAVVSVRDVVWLGFLLLLADTPGLQVFIIPILLPEINNEPDHLAAIAPITTFISIVMFAGAAGIFSTNILGPQIAQFITTFEEHRLRTFEPDKPDELLFDGKDFSIHVSDNEVFDSTELALDRPWLIQHNNRFYFYGSLIKDSPCIYKELDSKLFFPIDTLSTEALVLHQRYPLIYQNIIDIYLLDKKKELANLLFNSLLLASINILFVMPFMIIPKPILENAMHQNAHVSELTQEFVRYFFIAVPGTFYFLSCAQIVNCFQSSQAMLVNSAVFAASVGIACGLSIGTDLKEKGLLIPFVTQPYIASLLYTLYLKYHPTFRSLNLFNHLMELPQDWITKFKQFFDAGNALTVSIAVEIVLNFALSIYMGILDVDSQAAFALTMKYSSINILLGVLNLG